MADQTPLSEPKTIRVWADTARPGTCRGEKCRQPITFAENLKSGKQTPFNGPRLLPLAIERDRVTGRQIFVMDFEESHFRKCVDVKQFSAGGRR